MQTSEFKAVAQPSAVSGGGTGQATTTLTVATPSPDVRVLAWTGGLTILAFVVATLLLNVLPSEYRGEMFAFSLVVPTLIALFGAYLVRGDWRDAITSGFVVSYLILLLTSVSSSIGTLSATDATIRTTLVTSFTGLMTVVVAAYFTSEAAGEIAKLVTAQRVATTTTTSAAAGAAVAPAVGNVS